MKNPKIIQSKLNKKKSDANCLLTKHTHKQTQTHTYIINVSPYFILINKIINKTKWNKWINTIRCNNVQATNGATVKSFNNYTVSALSLVLVKIHLLVILKKEELYLILSLRRKNSKRLRVKKLFFFLLSRLFYLL